MDQDSDSWVQFSSLEITYGQNHMNCSFGVLWNQKER